MGYCTTIESFDNEEKRLQEIERSKDSNKRGYQASIPQKIKMVCHQMESDVDQQVRFLTHTFVAATDAFFDRLASA